MATNYSFQQFGQSLLDRLGFIHNVSDTFETGKNKLVFTINNHEVIISKDKEKLTGERKTIVECDEMFPCVFNNEFNKKYSQKEVDIVVNALDEYFLKDILEFKNSICNAAHYLKNGLLPFYNKEPNDKEGKQEIIDMICGKIFAMQEDLTFYFVGRNVSTNVYDKLFIIKHLPLELQIYIVNYVDNKNFGIDDNDENIKQISIQYSLHNDNLYSTIKKIIKTHDKFFEVEPVYENDEEEEEEC